MSQQYSANQLACINQQYGYVTVTSYSAPASPKEGERFGCMVSRDGGWSTVWWENEDDAIKQAKSQAETGRVAHVVKRVALVEPAAKVKKL